MAFVNYMKNLPPGFCFTPTMEELLLFYLPRRLKGEDFDPYVKDVDLYGDENEPWTLFGSNEQCPFYIFTDLKKIGKRIQRRAGCGTWSGQSNKEVKDRDGNVIGFDRYFSFQVKGGSDDQHSRWTMHEFALVDERGNSLDEKVVCIISRKACISTKQSVSVPKKRKIMASPTEEESCTNMLQGIPSPTSTLIHSDAQDAQQYLDYNEAEFWLSLDGLDPQLSLEFNEQQEM